MLLLFVKIQSSVVRDMFCVIWSRRYHFVNAFLRRRRFISRVG